MNFSVTFSVSSSRPAVLPHRKSFTGEQRQETRRCLCDCFVTEKTVKKKGEVGDKIASNKHTEMER